MRVYLVVLVSAVLLSMEASATDQGAERLIHNGHTYRMASYPLEVFFQKHRDRIPFGGVISTSLARGYIATYEIRDSLLWVVDIEVETGSDDSLGRRTYAWQSALGSTFPDSMERFCSHYTGLLILPYGEILGAPGLAPAPSERYRLVHISNGHMVGEKEFSRVDYFVFKKRQFQSYQKTKEYRKLYRDLRKDGRSVDMILGFLWTYDAPWADRFLLDEI